MMNLKSFVRRAKENGTKMLVFQSTPKRALYFTEDDARSMPSVMGEALAQAALNLAALSGETPENALDAIYAASRARAMAVIREKAPSKELSEEDQMRQFLKKGSVEELDDEDDEDDEDDSSSKNMSAKF